jgi:hypothetical protein
MKLSLFLAFACLLQGQTPDSRNRLWREDIDFFVKGISAKGMTVDLARGPSSRGQKDFEKLFPAKTFDPAIAALKESLPSLSDTEIVMRLMRIVAGAGVAHTSVEWPKGMGFERRLPVVMGWYGDGLAVASATQEFRSAVGRKVLKLGSKTPEELLAAVTPYISHENDAYLRNAAPGFLTAYPVVNQLGLADPDGMVSMVLERAGGEPLTVKLPLVESKEAKVGFWVALGIEKPPFVSQLNRKYWSRYFEDSRTEFIQYNQCMNDRALPFGEFTQGVMREIDAHPVQRVVLDLRWNGGGDSSVIGPLKNALASRPQLAGHIYVLIGAGTFSSALLNAIDWKQHLHATLAGEPTGGKPGSYGEVKLLTLPNSKVVVRYSSKYFAAPGGMDTPSLMPDILAPLKLSDLEAGRDSALDAILAGR